MLGINLESIFFRACRLAVFVAAVLIPVNIGTKVGVHIIATAIAE
jgi:hypothetical protein